MLKIIYGKMDGIIRRPGMYFDKTYDPECMDFGDGPYEIFFENTKSWVKTRREYLMTIFDIEEKEREGKAYNYSV